MKKIAVIQTAFPGDVVLASPLFEALKDRYPDTEITAVVRPESYVLLKNSPYIDDILIFDKYGKDSGFLGLLKTARKLSGFDWAVIVQRHFRSALLAVLAGIKKRTGFDNSSVKFLYTEKIKYAKDKHEVQRCLDLIGIDSLSKYRPRIYFDDECQKTASELLSDENIKGEFAVAAPGSVWATKRYPYYSSLIDLVRDELGLPTILLGGTGDIPLSKAVADQSGSKPVDFTGKTDFLVSAEIISRARIVFANDSAPSHIAAAVDTPVVSVFGPTTPEMGFAPCSEKSAIVDLGPLECRPCSTHGSDQCPVKHFKCMNDIKPEIIIKAAKLLLGS